MGLLRCISQEEAQLFLEDEKLEGPVFEEKINIKSGFFYDILKVEYFSPAKIFWRRVRKSARKYNSDTIVTNHYQQAEARACCGKETKARTRTCIEGIVKYYVSKK